MALLEVLIQIIIRFGQIVAAPIKHLDMLWIIVPIYLSWILADYYQERKGTDFGNAMSNGFVAVWVGIDWCKQIVASGIGGLSWIKILVSAIFVAYGLLIMIESARGKKIARYIGRVREVSYFMIVATPLYYGVVQLDLITIGAILLFFPVFYFVAELIDRVLPEPPGDDETSMKDIEPTKTMDLGADMNLGASSDASFNMNAGTPQSYSQQPQQGMPPMQGF